MLRTAIDSIISVVYPQQCYVCRDTVDSRHDGVACDRCWTETRIFDGSENTCGRCGALQQTENAVASCANCRDAHFDGAFAAGVYEKALAATVVRLKTHPLVSARAAASFRKVAARIAYESPAVIVPVPLSRTRKFERGYNQAEILSDLLSHETNFPVVKACLVRSTQTPMHRVAMDKRARELTVEKAFAIRSPRLIDGKDVLLVDDVLTSGSTASACARVLKKSGAAKVFVVTLARAVMHY